MIFSEKFCMNRKGSGKGCEFIIRTIL